MLVCKAQGFVIRNTHHVYLQIRFLSFPHHDYTFKRRKGQEGSKQLAENVISKIIYFVYVPRQ